MGNARLNGGVSLGLGVGLLVPLLTMAASCEDSPPSSPSPAGAAGQGEGGGGSGSTNAGGSDSLEGGAGAGGTEGGTGGTEAGGAGGEPGMACEASEVRLLLMRRGAEKVVLSYDESGRIRRASPLSQEGDYTYEYDAEGRPTQALYGDGAIEEGASLTHITYDDDVTTYADDDFPLSLSSSFEGARWLQTTFVSGDGGPAPGPSVASWDEEGLLVSVTSNVGKPAEMTETFSYERDALDHPVRMISSTTGASASTEIFDAAGHHLFQLELDPDDDTPVAVVLYRNNEDPVRSLVQSAYPWNARRDNAWLWAPLGPAAGSAGVTWATDDTSVRPLSLLPWAPLALSAETAVDFAHDLDGDEVDDVTGDYTFDDEGGLVSFELGLLGEPRVTVEMSYTPQLVTESVRFPGSDQPDETRLYEYGCAELGAGGAGP